MDGRVPSRPPDYTPKFRWLDVYRDAQAFRQEGPGLAGLISWLKPIVSAPRIYDTFAWDDPLPAWHWWRGFLQRWARR